MTSLNDENAWLIIKSFFSRYGYIYHQIGSYNKFLEDLRNIISLNSHIIVENKDGDYIVEFEEVKILPPCHKEVNDKEREVFPKECIDRNITYCSQILVDIVFSAPYKTTVHHNQYIGSIPVMVMSDACNLYKIRHDKEKMAKREENIYERGGYFVIKGSPKVVMTQERSAFNRVYVFGSHKYNPKFDLYSEVRSFSLSGSRQTTCKVGIFAKNHLISVCIPYIDGVSIPIGVLFRALGAKDEREIMSYISTDEEIMEMLIPSLEQSWLCDSQDTALHYIGRRGKKFTAANVTTVKKQRRKAIRSLLKIITIDTKLETIQEWLRDEESLELNMEKTEKFVEECCSQIQDVKTIEKKVDTIIKIVEKYIEEKVREEAISYATHLLSVEFLPHMGIGNDTFIRKRFYLGYMVKKLLLVFCGRENLTDRDNYKNKLNATTGILMTSLFSTVFKKFTTDIHDYIKKCVEWKKPVNILSSIRSKTITDIMSGALSNNVWSVKGKKSPGVSQQFDRLNYLAELSHTRRLVTPISSEGGKVEPPRKLHETHWMTVCPAATPEGKKAGLVKNLASTCLITIGEDPSALIVIVDSLDIFSFDKVIEDPSLLDLDKIFINGDMRGVTYFPEKIVKTLRDIRRSGGMNPETSISHNKLSKEIHISTEPGRLCRPMLIVSEGELVLSDFSEFEKGLWDEEIGGSWNKLLREGYIELIDKSEEDELMLVSSPSRFHSLSKKERMEITHCELHPSLMFGAGSSLVPYPDHNQSPRITYQASMGKQGVGRQPPNHIFMTKGTFYSLVYPQSPVLLTKMGDIFGFGEFPSSQNAVVAICPWYGYGQEDSIIINQDSVDRGFGKTLAYIGYEAVVRGEKNEVFEVPSKQLCSNFKGNPDKLDPETGIIPQGTWVETGDHLIGRTVVSNNSQSVHFRPKENISIIYNEKLPGRVHLVRHGKTRKKDDDDIEEEDDWRTLPNGKGYDYARVVVVQERNPIEGDKWCFSPDHDILTEEGWVSVKEITKAHSVASMKDGKLIYEHPTHIYEYDHNEQMVEISTNQINFCVTPNHNMYVKRRGRKDYKLERIDALFNTHVHYKKNAIWEAKGLDHFDLPLVWYSNTKNRSTLYPPQKLPIEDWLIFFGIWIAEGCAEKYRNTIAIHKDRVKKALKKSLEAMEFDYVVSKTGNVLNIHDKQLAVYMLPFSVGAIHKYLPDWVWKLNTRQCRILIDGLMLGDGHMNGTTPMYDTSSVRLKDDIMRLALHAGWAANAYIRYPKGRHQIIHGKDTVTNADSWRITIVQKQLEPAVNKHIKGQQKYIDYSGKVYCCTIPSGLLYVRRSTTPKMLQKPAWVSNSGSHGQKGTIGKALRSVDLPFTEEGITPDIIINPLAFPSRMTIGMLIEIIKGLLRCSGANINNIAINRALHLEDDEIEEYDDKKRMKKISYSKIKSNNDATPFDLQFSLDKICQELKKLGYNQFSDRIMTNGQTGDEMKTLIFTGICSYQRLKHMVIEKVHARSRGGRARLTRQPKEGRQQGGGLKNGVMETDILTGSGVSAFAKDRLMEQSDPSAFWYCRKCGLQALSIVDPLNKNKSSVECRVCSSRDVALIKIPYATKLLTQELSGMNIVPRILSSSFQK